jgi:hypothetical protein
MVFADVFAQVERRRRSVVFYNVEDHDLCERILDYIGAHDVIIDYVVDDEFPESTVVVQHNGETLSVDDAEAVANYIDRWESEMSSGFRPPALFGALDETVFRSSNKHQLLLASRLIESRAAMIGTGRFAAGFQQLSLAQPQLSLYTALPSAVTVSLYGEPDWIPPAETSITAYDPGTESHADYWWLVFDGAKQASQHVALLAEEQSSGEYTGFWTYRRSIIEAIQEVVDSFDARRVTDT